MNGRHIVTAVCVAAVVVLAVSLLVYSIGHVKPDSGTTACQFIATEAVDVAYNGDSKPWSNADYESMRKRFQASKHDDIRDSGTDFVDITWNAAQAVKNTRDADLSMAYAVPVTVTYRRLVAACANQQIFLPSLDSLNNIRTSKTPGPRVT